MTTIFDYGVAVNFLGNYKTQMNALHRDLNKLDQQLRNIAQRQATVFGGRGAGLAGVGGGGGRGGRGGWAGGAASWFGSFNSGVDRATSKLHNFIGGLFSLQNILIGGVLIGGIAAVSGAILGLGMRMETTFAKMETMLGSVRRTREYLDWAKRAAIETPFDIEQVNQGIGFMTSFGMGDNLEELKHNFKSIGDFAAVHNFDLPRATQMIAKAGFGNWESLADMTGIRANTMRGMAMEKQGITEETRKELLEYARIVETGTKGTEEFKKAIVDFVGTFYEGGMMKRVKTFGGAVTNLTDIILNFGISFLGYSQEAGTLFATMAETVQTKILEPLLKHSDALDRIGRRLGAVAISLWSQVDAAVESSVGLLERYITRLDTFLSDFKNNGAPLIVYLNLLVMLAGDLWDQFAIGFKQAFGPMWEGMKMMGEWFRGAINWIREFFGMEELSEVEFYARAFGWFVGSIVGLAGISVVFTPIRMLTGMLQGLFGVLSSIVGLGSTAGLGGAIGGAAGTAGLLGSLAKLGVGGLITAIVSGVVLGITAHEQFTNPDSWWNTWLNDNQHTTQIENAKILHGRGITPDKGFMDRDGTPNVEANSHADWANMSAVERRRTAHELQNRRIKIPTSPYDTATTNQQAGPIKIENLNLVPDKNGKYVDYEEIHKKLEEVSKGHLQREGKFPDRYIDNFNPFPY